MAKLFSAAQQLASRTGGFFLREWHRQAFALSAQGRRLETFRNRHAGEDCFVIGNGPSLNKMDLEQLNDYHTFGLNKIFLIFARQHLKLSYHVSVNTHVIQQSLDPFKQLNCPTFLKYEDAYSHFKSYDNVFYLVDAEKRTFHPDITTGIWQGHTVTFAAMQIAYFMGFRRVFLVGVDHNFVQQGKPNTTQTMQGDDLNHFDPNYFKGQKWDLADLMNSEIAYFIARKHFEADNRQVIDATIGGQCTIFEKMELAEAFAIMKKKNTR